MTSLEDQILEELCYANGLSLAEMKSSKFKVNESVKSLEMFFNGFSTIMHVDKFPNLTELKIVAQELTTITCLETCINLTELWVIECKLTKISGLKNCRSLKKLFLYSNQLTKIENLETLSLEVLWLNDNKINEIEGFSHMIQLTELNLAKNLIESIGDTLNTLRNLETLNLAGNLIENLEEINSLQILPNLRYLCFKDPQYGYNPVTNLCNYSLYVIYHLPGLTSLDTLNISQKVVKELADATINKKKLWYYMRLSTVSRQLDEIIEKLDAIKMKHCLPHLIQINSFTCKMREFKKSNECDSALSTEQKQKQEEAIRILQEKINEIQPKIKLIESQYQHYLKSVLSEIENKRKFIYMELENGGNIRFDFGDSSEPWYKSCYDLLMSRFCATEYLLKSINGIKIRKVIRFTNRILLAKYEESLLNEVDENDYINNKPSLRKKIDYLMYCWRPRMGSLSEELFDIIKSGFDNPDDYKKKGYDRGVPFSNSLSVCDHYRIEQLRDSSKQAQNSLRYGIAILCKVFTGKFADLSNEASDNTVDVLGTKRLFRPSGHSSSNQDVSKICDCKSKQFEWFLYNKNLAVPEYIIEYEYMHKPNSENMFETELDNVDLQSNESQEYYDVSKMDKSQQRAIKTEEFIGKEIEAQLSKLMPNPSDVPNYNLIEELNLHNCELTELDNDPFRNTRNLKKLTLSFNKLKSIRELNTLNNLEYLDVSYNQIESLSGFKIVSKINYFDVSNNQLNDIMHLAYHLKHYFPILNYLDITNNNFKRHEKLRSILLFSLRSLVFYNGEKIQSNDKDFADNKIKVTKELIKANSQCIVNKPRSLSYLFVAETLRDKSTNKKLESNNSAFLSTSPHGLIDNQSSDLFSKITTLNLDNQGLYKLTNMDYLVNLKWASFNNNFICKIEGIGKCVKLEELSFENNLIQSFNGLENLENLRKLNLNCNEIFLVDDHSESSKHEFKLTKLVYLSVCKNKLTSFKFVAHFTSLIEFYASFNQLKNLRDVFHLKNVTNLTLCDLWGNPISKSPKYRLFIIYHLKNLKSLDGSPIEPSENNEAKEHFGGKLTCDFIAEKFQNVRLNDIKSLEFPQCGIKVVDLGTSIQTVSEQFENLRAINLENNSLTSFSGLVYLRNLKILCLNNNKIESIFPKSSKNANNSNTLNDLILPNLEVLHLAFNGINDLVTLQIGRLVSLKALFLQGNDIARIEGIETLRNLRELVLDKNKIKNIGEISFVGQTTRLTELHIEENRLRDLVNIERLKNLHKLFVANNKISEFSDLERLSEMSQLHELSFINNPVCRRPHYRITVAYKLKRVRVLDMTDITDEDRIKAEIYFAEQQQLQQQAQMYYNGMMPSVQQIVSNPMAYNQIDTHALYNQSPRLKPIVDKHILLNNQGASNSGNANKKYNKNSYDKVSKDFPARYKN